MKEKDKEILWAKHREALYNKDADVTLHVNEENAEILADLINELLKHEHKMQRTSPEANPRDPFDALTLNVNRAVIYKGGDIRLTGTRINAVKRNLERFLEESGFPLDGPERESRLVLMAKLDAAYAKAAEKPGIVHEFNMADPLPKQKEHPVSKSGALGRTILRVIRRG